MEWIILFFILIIISIYAISKVTSKSTQQQQKFKITSENHVYKRPINTKIAGVTQNNEDGSNRQNILKTCQPEDKLLLRREHYNKYDKNAIQILLKRTGKQLGYINREVTAEIAPYIDSGNSIWAEITSLTGGSAQKPTIGCNIRIYIEEK